MAFTFFYSSVPLSQNHNTFRLMRSNQFNQITDLRQDSKIDYTLHDCMMSGFAMMYFQDPSLLCFQKRIQESTQRNNLSTVFNVGTIPKDTQMREVPETIESEAVEPVFSDFLRRLQRGKQRVQYQFVKDTYLISLDGSQYFSSQKIHCPHCLVKSKKAK